MEEPDAWVESSQATIIFGVAILVNSLVIAFETDLDPETQLELAPTLLGVDIFFILFFSWEITLRARAQRRGFFKDAWNWFDVVVVGLGVVLRLV